MSDKSDVSTLLRGLPSVDKVMREPSVISLLETVPRAVVAHRLRRVLEETRARILAEPKGSHDVSLEAVVDQVRKAVARWDRSQYMRVVNGAGIVLHTGLGRAPYCLEAVEALADTLRGYSRLAFDLPTGRRRAREEDVRDLLCELTGAESAQVVNNNAAGTMLVLNTVADGKEVIVARGQLVEIGGAFRIPEVMEMSGAKLKEIGTTNRVHLRDYVNAINENTGAILKVHTSNYRIVGFHSEVPIDALSTLGAEKGVPVVDDLGSGAVVDIENLFDLDEEPLVQQSMRAGCDLVCFSGDKLLGGPQCGIILGKTALIEKVRSNPLMRALRVDKMTCIVLEQTLKVLLDEEGRLKRHTVFEILNRPAESLRVRAEALRDRIQAQFGEKIQVEVIEERSQIGAGTTPTKSLPTWAVTLKVPGTPDGLLGCKLRTQPTPVCGRVQKEGVLLDLRTFLDGDEAFVLEALGSILREP
ncbi:MAG: L-seryl-tRNA(Sec) selenium transferase [Planctomycetota bacterium]|jgi:L-seryl-tRNA(Ser) seleniumtransferase